MKIEAKLFKVSGLKGSERSGGVRALGVDQKLFIKTVFLKILSRGNIRLGLV